MLALLLRVNLGDAVQSSEQALWVSSAVRSFLFRLFQRVACADSVSSGPRRRDGCRRTLGPIDKIASLGIMDSYVLVTESYRGLDKPAHKISPPNDCSRVKRGSAAGRFLHFNDGR